MICITARGAILRYADAATVPSFTLRVPAEGTLTYAGPRDLPGSMENPAPSHWIDAATDEFICEGRPDSGGT